MRTIYTNEEYSKSYTELLEILRYFSQSDLCKIPKHILERYLKERDLNYKFSYNPNLNIEQQNVTKLTQILLANLYINYLADENEQKYLKNRDLHELEQIEKQNQEKYNIQTIFNKRKKEIINKDSTEITSLTIIPDKKNIFKKVFYKIRAFFKLT